MLDLLLNNMTLCNFLGCAQGVKTFSAATRTHVMSSPIYGIFSLRSGEYSYTLVNTALIAQHSGTGRKQAHC